jgi:hypothetical protein
LIALQFAWFPAKRARDGCCLCVANSVLLSASREHGGDGLVVERLAALIEKTAHFDLGRYGAQAQLSVLARLSRFPPPAARAAQGPEAVDDVRVQPEYRSPRAVVLFSKLTEPGAWVLAIASNVAWLMAMRTMPSPGPRRVRSRSTTRNSSQVWFLKLTLG